MAKPKRKPKEWPKGTDNLGTEPDPVPPRPPPPRRSPGTVNVPEQVVTSSSASSSGWGWVLLLALLASRKGL